MYHKEIVTVKSFTNLNFATKNSKDFGSIRNRRILKLKYTIWIQINNDGINIGFVSVLDACDLVETCENRTKSFRVGTCNKVEDLKCYLFENFIKKTKGFFSFCVDLL